MVDAEHFHDGGVEVMDVDGVFDDVVRELVGFAPDGTAFGAAAGHPHAEAARVVVAAVIIAAQAALAVDGSSKFTAPDDEGILEHAAVFEVGDEAMDRLVGVFALERHAAAAIAMVVPVVVVDLHEAHTAFDQSTGEQGGVGEAAGIFRFFAVEGVGAIRLGADLREFGHAALHAEGHFELLDAGMSFGIAHQLVIHFIERLQAIELTAAQVPGDAGGVVDEEDGIAAGAEADARVFAWQEPSGPQSGGNSLHLFAIGRLSHQHHEGRQIRIQRAQPITQP